MAMKKNVWIDFFNSLFCNSRCDRCIYPAHPSSAEPGACQTTDFQHCAFYSDVASDERTTAQAETVVAPANAYSDVGTARFGICASIFR